MDSVPIGTTSQTSQPTTSHALTLQLLSSPSSTGLPPGLTPSIIFLSFLAALAFTIYWTRRRRTTPEVSDERPSRKEDVHDVEALAASRPIIVPVTPLADVRWQPQIRSISGPTLDKGSDRKSATPPLKRARSPPPSIKTRSQFPDPYAVSAPPHVPFFSQVQAFHPPKSSKWDVSPPVTPHALAASGLQTRSLGRPGLGSES